MPILSRKTNQTKNINNRPSISLILALTFFLICLFVLTISDGLLLFVAIQSQKPAITVHQIYIAKEAAQTVQDFIEMKFDLLKSVVQVTRHIEVPIDEQKTILENLLEIQPTFRQLALFDEKNQMITYATHGSVEAINQMTDHLDQNAFGQTQDNLRIVSPV
jgi:hypothetical protein